MSKTHILRLMICKGMGRPRKVGKRLSTLKSLLDAPQTDWQALTIEGWYGGRACELQVTSQTAVWYHTGLPAVPGCVAKTSRW